MAETQGDTAQESGQSTGDASAQHGTARKRSDIYDGQQPAPAPMPTMRANVDIHDPMSLWIMLLMAAVVLRILITSTAYLPIGTEGYMVANTYSSFLLQFPGIIILPLVIGIVIGSEVGERSATLASTLKNGLTNGIYASIIYLVTIIIIYIILSYATPQFSSIYNTVINSVVLPILVFIVTLEIFAVLAHSRKVDA